MRYLGKQLGGFKKQNIYMYVLCVYVYISVYDVCIYVYICIYTYRERERVRECVHVYMYIGQQGGSVGEQQT